MICQNCQANVDNDLIFCTNCGERLFETKNEAQTVLMKDSGVTKTTLPNAPKTSSNIKWIALITGLIAIPASLFGGYLLLSSNRSQTTVNANKSDAPVSLPTRKANNNQKNSVNISNANSDISNSNTNAVNQNANSANNSDKTEIMNEEIEILPDSDYAIPFNIADETAKITGNVQILQGEPLEGYVFLQEMYDQHFPDTNFKVFSFDVTKNENVDQTLVKGDYVLVFVNKNAKSSVVQGKFVVEK